jgi:hypothetical protein
MSHDFIKINGVIIFTDSLIRKTETLMNEITQALNVPEVEAIKYVGEHFQNLQHRMMFIGELLENEHLSQFKKEELVLIKNKIVEDKYAFARQQQYEYAANYRDIENVLKEAIIRKEANNE